MPLAAHPVRRHAGSASPHESPGKWREAFATMGQMFAGLLIPDTQTSPHFRLLTCSEVFILYLQFPTIEPIRLFLPTYFFHVITQINHC